MAEPIPTQRLFPRRRRTISPPLAFALALATALGSCKTPTPVEDLSGRARMIGLIESLRTSGRFVLIQRLAVVTDEEGTELISYDRDGTQTGRLQLSSERRRNLLTADIVSGNPKEGDFVVLPGADGEEWMPEALPPVMIDDGQAPTGMSPDVDSLPELRPPPGVGQPGPEDLPELTLPPGISPGDDQLPEPPEDLGP